MGEDLRPWRRVLLLLAALVLLLPLGVLSAVQFWQEAGEVAEAMGKTSEPEPPLHEKLHRGGLSLLALLFFFLLVVILFVEPWEGP